MLLPLISLVYAVINGLNIILALMFTKNVAHFSFAHVGTFAPTKQMRLGDFKKKKKSFSFVLFFTFNSIFII